VHNVQIVDGKRARKGNASRRVFTVPNPSQPMSSPVSPVSPDPNPPVPNVPAAPDHAGLERIDPATVSKMGSMTYDREENGYNLEWESRADFKDWLAHEQAAIGIEIRLSKTRRSRAQELYSTCETFRCARNGTGGKSHYVKKTTRERKIESKRIEGGCPCYVQIKTYPYTDTILGKYSHDHSHPTGKDNLKYIRIRVATRDLIEAWVHYGVTDQEIVSDPLLNHD
jgi:hypothetical protein